jgi:Zn-dependent alcohol dehydrogenase
MRQVRAVVARSKGQPASVETIAVPDPGPGEAVVAIQACGVMAATSRRYVTETIGLDDVEEAFHRMERGEVLRSVVVL